MVVTTPTPGGNRQRNSDNEITCTGAQKPALTWTRTATQDRILLLLALLLQLLLLLLPFRVGLFPS